MTIELPPNSNFAGNIESSKKGQKEKKLMMNYK